MAQRNEGLTGLINYTCSEDHERPDLEACLEISDRVNSTKPECMEAITAMTKCLGKPSLKVVLNTVQLLETLCKNCNMRFLYELNNKKLVEALMKVLEKRREQTKYNTKSKKPVDKLKVQVEDKILYLIQLWADTFMMHQDEFKNIHEAYRTLRKEGVKFPDRDPNEKFMMNFQGTISPIFLAMDENYIVPSNNQGGPQPDPSKYQTQAKPVHKGPEYQHEVQPSAMPVNTLYNEDEEYDYTVYDGVEISRDEIKVIEESMGILKEIEMNAVKPGDMKSEIANEILGDLVHVHKRIKRLILMDKFTSNSQRNEAMKLNDKINESLLSYRSRYNFIKENYNKGIIVEPLVQAQEEHREGIELSNDIQKESKKESHQEEKSTKKTEFVGARKLAPPKGWKAPVEKTTNPDLIDLLGETPGTQDGTPTANKEEHKEEAPKTTTEKHHFLDDLLNMDFSSPLPNKETTTGSGVNSMFAQPQQNFLGPMNQPPMGGFQIPQNQLNPVYPQGFVHPNYGQNMPLNFAGGNNYFAHQQPGVTGIHDSLSPISPSKVQEQSTSQNQTPTNVQNQNNNNAAGGFGDDDDFFADIANRKK